MASERNYWSTDQLWQDYNYHRRAMEYYVNWGRTEYALSGRIWNRTDRRIASARENMRASWDFLCRKLPKLLAPDENAMSDVEGRTRFIRSSQVRY